MFKKIIGTSSEHKPNTTISKKFWIDSSGTKTFKFNSMGYRGEEYNPKAKKKIFVCGCSYTFGPGLNWEETWPYQFKKLISQKEKSKLYDINLLNFSSHGVSNDYIARTVLTQCKDIKPDLLIIYFTHIDRTEYICNNEVTRLGTWSLGGGVQEALYYYSYYTDEMGLINRLKNMLLLQYFCKQKSIEYIFAYHKENRLNYERLNNNPICSQFIKLIDKNHLCDFKFEAIDFAEDKFPDSVPHPGPKSNKLFAERLFKFYKKNISKE